MLRGAGSGHDQSIRDDSEAKPRPLSSRVPARTGVNTGRGRLTELPIIGPWSDLGAASAAEHAEQSFEDLADGFPEYLPSYPLAQPPQQLQTLHRPAREP